MSRLKTNKQTKKEQNNVQKPEMATLRMKAEEQQTNTQTDIKIYHNSHSNRTGETTCTNSQAKKWRSYSTAALRVLLFCFRVFAFVLHRHVNLNKERNKWARRLGVDALVVKRTRRLVSAEKAAETQEAAGPGV